MSISRDCVLGVDLAGSDRRPTGMCLLYRDYACRCWIVYRDVDIILAALAYLPRVIAIDAPLTLPRGRKSLTTREPIHFRSCDLELRRRGIRFFPITLGPMRTLTARGMLLKKDLKELGFNVIEVYPGGAQDVWGLPRKSKDLNMLIDGLRSLGLRGLRMDMTGDEADAATCALVGLLYIDKRYEALGDVDEGQIIMPLPICNKSDKRCL